MASNPTVSVVVATYRGARFVARMIDSVCAQTFGDWELIVVDGTSNDGTAECVAGYRRRLGDRLVFIEQPNQGCNAARNTGIAAARCEYVAFLDVDDEYLPTKLDRQLELFRLRPDLGLVYSDYSYVDLSGTFHPSVFDVETPLAREVPYEEVAPNLRVCTPDLFEYLVRGYFISTIVGMVRRSVLGDDVRFYAHNWYGLCEWMFYLDVVRRCRAGYVNEPLCVNHFVSGSISRTSRLRNNLDHRALLRTMKTRYVDVSRTARRSLGSSLAHVCRQLGMDSYKAREYGSATRYFAEALGNEPSVRTAAHLLQSLGRWAARGGQGGDEPRLRVGNKEMESETAKEVACGGIQ